VLLPVYELLVTSFKSGGESPASPASALPQMSSLRNWKLPWATLSPSTWCSVQLVLPQAIIAALFGSINAFLLSRWKFRGATIIFTLILFGMFIPYQAVIIPLTKFLLALEVPSGVPSLILLHVVYGIPITTLIFRNYYESVPNELIEAARMDGA